MAKTEYQIEPGKQEIVMTRVFDEDLTAGFGTKAIHAGWTTRSPPTLAVAGA